MDNSKNRLNDVFFYGLYMDEEVLKSKGVNPRNKKVTKVLDYRLRIGNMATLLREEGSIAYGLTYSLTHEEIYNLYTGAGLDAYVSEALIAEVEGKNQSVLCCNLLNPPKQDEFNSEYYEKLKACMNKYDLPLPSKSVK